MFEKRDYNRIIMIESCDKGVDHMQRGSDLTTGNIGRKVIGFVGPIILTNLIQAIYGLVDMVTVGHFVGASGMSAVSMGAQITTVVLVLVNGLSNGGTVVSAQLAGQGKREELKPVFGTLLTFFLIASVIVTAVGMVLARPLLRVINTPEAAFEQAVEYLLICMGGTIFVYGYNSMAAQLRAVGNSKAPMVIVIITVILNAILDVLFVAVLRMGVAGAALATVICQCASLILVSLYIKYKTDLFDFKRASFRIHKHYLTLVLKIGLPQAIQFLFASSSFVFMSGLVNIYGVDASAAAGAAAKIQMLANVPAQGMMAGLMTVTAQNLAVGQPKRVVEGFRTGASFVTVIGLAIFAFCMAWPQAAFRIFTPELAVADIGIEYLRCMAFSFVLESIMFCMFGIISGSGYTPVTMCCGILSAFAARYSCAWLLSQTFMLGFKGIGIAYNAGPVITSLVCVVFLLTGKWKTARISVSKGKH